MLHTRSIVWPREESAPQSGLQRKPAYDLTALPRLQSSPSISDGTTSLSDVIVELARLSERGSVPRLLRDVTPDDELAPQESFIIQLVFMGLDVETILDTSPLSEDVTLRFLARLVESRIITVQAA